MCLKVSLPALPSTSTQHTSHHLFPGPESPGNRAWGHTDKVSISRHLLATKPGAETPAGHLLYTSVSAHQLHFSNPFSLWLSLSLSLSLSRVLSLVKRCKAEADSTGKHVFFHMHLRLVVCDCLGLGVLYHLLMSKDTKDPSQGFMLGS